MAILVVVVMSSRLVELAILVVVVMSSRLVELL